MDDLYMSTRKQYGIS